MYFHESIPTCLAVLISEGEPIDEGTLILRDAVGRLTVVRRDMRDKANLAEALTVNLAGYAARPPAVDGRLADKLLSDPEARIVEIGQGDDLYSIRYIDRRLAGMDWLLEPQQYSRPDSTPPRLVFASMKGGVGRSTALCIVAAKLAAQGKRVLTIDLDLEAPGIGFMLLPQGHEQREDRRPKYGVLDYLLETGISGVKDEELTDFVGTSLFHEGSIDVVPAVGRATDDYPVEFIQKLVRAVIEDVQDNKVIPLWMQIRDMIERFESQKQYDAVLIDARAGLAEISAAPLLSLGAYNLFFATDQEQTFRSFRYLLSHMSSRTDFSMIEPGTDWRQRLLFVQAKAGSTTRRRVAFRERIYDLCAEWLYEIDTDIDINQVEILSLAFSPAETGMGVPHDASFIRYDAAYDAFDPSTDGDQLDPDVYNGPFGAFLKRIDAILLSHRRSQS